MWAHFAGWVCQPAGASRAHHVLGVWGAINATARAGWHQTWLRGEGGRQHVGKVYMVEIVCSAGEREGRQLSRGGARVSPTWVVFTRIRGGCPCGVGAGGCPRWVRSTLCGSVLTAWSSRTTSSSSATVVLPGLATPPSAAVGRALNRMTRRTWRNGGRWGKRRGGWCAWTPNP
jgi:hypothetical protein